MTGARVPVLPPAVAEVVVDLRAIARMFDRVAESAVAEADHVRARERAIAVWRAIDTIYSLAAAEGVAAATLAGGARDAASDHG